MPEPQLRDIFGEPEYVGPVTAVKREYHVFRAGRGDFAVFSRSNRSAMSFHKTFVPAARLEALKQSIPKKGTTSNSLLKEERVLEAFGTEDRQALYFDVLTTLYAMAALDIVSISKSGRNLVFTPLDGP